MSMRISALSFCSLLLVGCATFPVSIRSQNVDATQFLDRSCEQLVQLRLVTETQMQRPIARQYTRADKDGVMALLGLFVWPFLFLIDGNGEDYETIATLKGRSIAIDRVLSAKGCLGV